MLKEKLQKDLNDALKTGDSLKRLVLGMAMTSIKNKELAKRQQLSKTVGDTLELENQSQLADEEILEVLSGEVKKRKESIEQFETGGRKELAQKEKSEIDILMAYLPEQLSEEELRTEVEKIISELNASGAKDIGKIIGAIMAKFKGRVDGGMASKIAKKILGLD